MNNDDKRKYLEQVELVADCVSDSHPHECGAGELARDARDLSQQMQKDLGTSHGPSQVSTPQYRSGWETIFGAKQVVGVA